jgi:hypothetical protein
MVKGRGPWPAEDEKMTETMSAYWTDFIETGDPNGMGNVADVRKETGSNDGIGQHDGAMTNHQP